MPPIDTSARSTFLLQIMLYGEQAEHTLQATFAASRDHTSEQGDRKQMTVLNLPNKWSDINDISVLHMSALRPYDGTTLA